MSRKLHLNTLAVALGFIPTFAFAETTAYITGSAELHAGPDFDYPTVDVVHDGESVVVHGCLRDWSWCDVGFDGYRGWMSADNLMGEYQSRRQPIASVGPRMGLGVLDFRFSTYWDNNYRRNDFYGERSRWESYANEHQNAHREQVRQRRERDEHDAAHRQNVRDGMYKDLREQKREKEQHDELHEQHEQDNR